MRLMFAVLCLAAVSARGAVLQELLMDGYREPVTGNTVKLGDLTYGGGQVFAQVTLSGPGVNASNDRAVLYGNAASPRLLLREGDPIPGFPTQKISGLTGLVGPNGWYGVEGYAIGVINGRSAVTYASTVIGNATTSRIVAKTGDIAPELGTAIQSVRPTYVLSDTDFGLQAFFPPPTSTSAGPMAEYRTKTDGSLQLMFTTTTAMPQLPSNYQSQLITHSLYNAGRSLWTLGHLTPGYAWASGRQSLFLSTDRGHALVMQAGEPQPVTPATGADRPVGMWLGDDGSFVFSSSFLDDENYFYGIGLYSGNESVTMLRRLPQQVFVDQPGRRVTAIGDVDSNRSGLMVMSAGVPKIDWTEALNVIGVGTIDSGFRTLVAPGAAAPGLDGVTFSGFAVANNPSDVWINDAGDVAFYATLGGAGVDVTNDRSIWLRDHTGAMNLMLREGDPFAYQGVTRTISTFAAAGNDASFDDDGRLRLVLGFTDGTRGLFEVSVPEPSSFAAVAALASWHALYRRRRPERH